MSLEYGIDCRCPVQDQYGLDRLRRQARLGSLVSRIVGATIESPHLPSAEILGFTAEKSEEIAELGELSALCRDQCKLVEMTELGEIGEWEPIAAESIPPLPVLEIERVVREESLGCAGRIRYPIEGRVERFVADRLQLILDTVRDSDWPAMVRLVMMADSPFDGELTKELRRVTTAEGLRFFELRRPLQLIGRGGHLTSDHIFDLLSGFQSADGAITGYSREIPREALGDYHELLEALLIDDLGEDEERRWLATSTTFAQYYRFLVAIRAAIRLGVRILMD